MFSVSFSGKEIVIRRKKLDDSLLNKIGIKRPVSLTITQCHSNKVTAEGLRNLFRSCGDSLEVCFCCYTKLIYPIDEANFFLNGCFLLIKYDSGPTEIFTVITRMHAAVFKNVKTVSLLDLHR